MMVVVLVVVVVVVDSFDGWIGSFHVFWTEDGHTWYERESVGCARTHIKWTDRRTGLGFSPRNWE